MPDPDARPDQQQVAAAVQAALDATARRLTAGAGGPDGPEVVRDPRGLLVAQLESRGVDLDDEAWLDAAVGHLLDGQPVVVDEEPGRPAPTDPSSRGRVSERAGL